MTPARTVPLVWHYCAKVTGEISRKSRSVGSILNASAGSKRVGALCALFVLGIAALVYTGTSASTSRRLSSRTPATTASGSEKSSAAPASKIERSKEEASIKLADKFFAGRAALAPLAPQVSGPETVAIFAADCTTPKTSFSLGEVVCAKVTNAPVVASLVLRRFSWAARSLETVRTRNITTSTQTDTFTLPSTALNTVNGETIDNRGVWRVNTIATDGSTRTAAFFTVHDPAKASADLQVAQDTSQVNSQVEADQDVAFNVYVSNAGPDTAQGVSFTSNTPANTTFVSATGPTGFTCNNSGGVTTCTAAAGFAANGTATFVLTYHVNAGTPIGTVISNTVDASISSTMDELDDSNNSSTFNLTVTAQAETNDNCTITCPGNITSSVTGIKIQLDQDGDPVLDSNGQPIPVLDGNGNTIPGANVTFSVDAEGSACAPVTCTNASGSFFGVGTTAVTCTSATNESCTFDVTVVGVTITLNGPNPMLITCLTQPFSDPGATATLVGGGSAQVTTSGTVPTDGSGHLIEGTYTITYSASDGNGGTASVTRTVVVDESSLPSILINGGSNVTVECHTSYTDAGATASVSCSGSIPVTTSGTVDVNTPGTYTITYSATSGGNTVTADRTVTVVDTTAPTLALNGANPMTVECHTGFVDPGVTASDSCAGGAGVTVTTSGTVDANTVGTYTVTYNGVDPSGNEAAPVTRTVNVVDTTPPVITMVGGNMTVECHTSFTDPGASANDGCEGPVPVSTSGSVDVNTPGTYTLTYSATDAHGNTGTATRTVTVVDTTPPVISCPADIVVYLPLNSPATSMAVSYPAPTATDSCSSTVNVTTSQASGSVFPVGTTTVTATATDPSGNSSSCTFKVTVLYNFTGFFSPIGNLPTLNVANAGRAIPIKFSLSGNKGLNIFAANSPASGVIACDSNAPANELTNTITAGGSSLSYDATTDQYIYVWKTESAWAGTCRQLVVTLNDGSVHVANFKFK
jgi:hypothetical protein